MSSCLTAPFIIPRIAIALSRFLCLHPGVENFTITKTLGQASRLFQKPFRLVNPIMPFPALDSVFVDSRRANQRSNTPCPSYKPRAPTWLTNLGPKSTRTHSGRILVRVSTFNPDARWRLFRFLSDSSFKSGPCICAAAVCEELEGHEIDGHECCLCILAGGRSHGERNAAKLGAKGKHVSQHAEDAAAEHDFLGCMSR